MTQISTISSRDMPRFFTPWFGKTPSIWLHEQCLVLPMLVGGLFKLPNYARNAILSSTRKRCLFCRHHDDSFRDDSVSLKKLGPNTRSPFSKNNIIIPPASQPLTVMHIMSRYRGSPHTNSIMMPTRAQKIPCEQPSTSWNVEATNECVGSSFETFSFSLVLFKRFFHFGSHSWWLSMIFVGWNRICSRDRASDPCILLERCDEIPSDERSFHAPILLYGEFLPEARRVRQNKTK